MMKTPMDWRTAWARIARPQAFDDAVENYRRRALTQPFSDPLSYVQQFARASRSDPFRRAVWLEVERSLQRHSAAAAHPQAVGVRRLGPASLAAGLAFSSTLYAVAVSAVWMLRHHPR